MPLDPFTDCPFVILGLPLSSSELDINRKWKTLLMSGHPDKNEGSDLSHKKTQIYNDARGRAIQKLTSYECILARRNVTSYTDLINKTNAEEKRKLYEARWFEEETKRCADQMLREQAKALNEAYEKGNRERAKAEREQMEKDRLHKANVRRMRRHTKTWVGDKFEVLKLLVKDFVAQYTVLKEKSFISCKRVMETFTKKHSLPELDTRFFYRRLRAEVLERHDKAQWKSTVVWGDKGYRGITMLNIN